MNKNQFWGQKCYSGYNVKFVLLIIHFVAILEFNLSPWYCSYKTTVKPMKIQLSVWRWVLRSTQLCSALLVPSLHRSLCSNCSWNISPFYFYRRWVFVFFVSMAPTALLILPKLVPCATLPRDLCVCMCVELPIFEEGQIWECRRFLKLPFLCLCSRISECRWEAMLKWLILSSVHVFVCACMCGW